MRFVIAFTFLIATFAASFLYAGDCKEHIELHSAADLAKEYGQTEMWILQNVKINFGKMYPGSRALIIEEGDQDYKVKSPLDKSVGWISKIQVKLTLWQDVDTREPCKP